MELKVHVLELKQKKKNHNRKTVSFLSSAYLTLEIIMSPGHTYASHQVGRRDFLKLQAISKQQR